MKQCRPSCIFLQKEQIFPSPALQKKGEKLLIGCGESCWPAAKITLII